ncbi:hypothetical protein D9758_014052 [Tetrapyrgos nigripes]|uniref:Uncharacterized protein n=1 Tax=Tetrapyrgos nigripes TaxID=182062 RepID=A0A8H5FLW4_9AGAR|nr:hypothetical protein D9758_014052 [Tetrapyrgos nigripes]
MTSSNWCSSVVFSSPRVSMSSLPPFERRPYKAITFPSSMSFPGLVRMFRRKLDDFKDEFLWDSYLVANYPAKTKADDVKRGLQTQTLSQFMEDYKITPSPYASLIRRELVPDAIVPRHWLKALAYGATRVLYLNNVDPYLKHATISDDFSQYMTGRGRNPLNTRSEDNRIGLFQD